MLHSAEITVRIALAVGVRVTFRDTLAVSLDCCICHRCWRTVVFETGANEGRCTPTGHAFPGTILTKQVTPQQTGVTATYRIAYQYESFLDAKYPDRLPVARPSWARVSFDVLCPACGLSAEHSMQNNTVRPWTCRCKCKQVLYTETEEMPVLTAIADTI